MSTITRLTISVETIVNSISKLIIWHRNQGTCGPTWHKWCYGRRRYGRRRYGRRPKFYLICYKFCLACLVIFLVGWVNSSVSTPFVWYMSPQGLHQSLPLWSSPGFGFGSLSLHHLHFEIGPLLTATSVLGHLYADAIQAYLHCTMSNAIAAVSTMSKTLGVAGTWISTNRLRLNPSKNNLSGLALGSSLQS